MAAPSAASATSSRRAPSCSGPAGRCCWCTGPVRRLVVPQGQARPRRARAPPPRCARSRRRPACGSASARRSATSATRSRPARRRSATGSAARSGDDDVERLRAQRRDRRGRLGARSTRRRRRLTYELRRATRSTRRSSTRRKRRHPRRPPARRGALPQGLAGRRPAPAAARGGPAAGRAGWCRCWRPTAYAGWSAPAAPGACRPSSRTPPRPGSELARRRRAQRGGRHQGDVRRLVDRAGRRTSGAAGIGRWPVLCTHRPVLPWVFDALGLEDPSWRPARCWSSAPAQGPGRRRPSGTDRLNASLQAGAAAAVHVIGRRHALLGAASPASRCSSAFTQRHGSGHRRSLRSRRTSREDSGETL